MSYCRSKYGISFDLLRHSDVVKITLLFGLISFHLNQVFGQNNSIVFEEEKLAIVLDRIQEETDYNFNYDPVLLEPYIYSGSVSKENLDNSLTHILYSTPFAFEKNRGTYLIYLPEAQEIFICGTVRDAMDSSSLPGANIYIEDKGIGVTSDTNGNFELNLIAHKNEMVHVSFIGYETKSISVQEWTRGCKNILLRFATNTFGEAVIVADYILDGVTEGERYSSVSLDYDFLIKKQSIIEQDVLKSTQLLPGISSVDESAANLQIRGNTPDQNLIMWENVTLYDPGHVFGMISAINPFVVDKVEVFKGVFSPKYDNRVGGVIDISLRDSLTRKFHGGLGSTMSEAHANVEVPIVPEKLSLLAAGRKTVDGLISSPTLNSYSSKVFQNSKIEEQKEEVAEGERSVEQNLDYSDINLKVLFRPLEKLRFQTSYFSTRNEFNYDTEIVDGELESRDRVLFRSSALSSSLSFDYANNKNLTLGYTKSTFDNNYEVMLVQTEDDETFEHNELLNLIEDQSFFLDHEWLLTSNLKSLFGYDRNYKEVRFDYTSFFESEPVGEDINAVKGNFNNFYSSLNYSGKSLLIDGGLRATHFEETKTLVFSPRLNFQYRINDDFKLKASGGIFQQFISQLREFGENELGLNNRIWVFEDSDQEDNYVESQKLSAGFVIDKNGWLLDVEGYRSHTTGLTTLNPLFNTSIELEDDYFRGTATNQGLDILVKKRMDPITSWLNYSLSKGTYLFQDIDEDPFPTSSDQRHVLNFINNWKYKNWTFSLNYQFRTGLPFSLPSYIEEGEDDEGGSYYSLVYERLNMDRLPDYSRLDIGFNYRPELKKMPFKLEINGSITNVLNTLNILSREYYLADLEDTDGIPEYYDVERRLLKRTPYLSLRIYW